MKVLSVCGMCEQITHETLPLGLNFANKYLNSSFAQVRSSVYHNRAHSCTNYAAIYSNNSMGSYYILVTTFMDLYTVSHLSQEQIMLTLLIPVHY